jgi:hypothetical protein
MKYAYVLMSLALVAQLTAKGWAEEFIPLTSPVNRSEPKTKAVPNASMTEGIRVFPNPWRADKNGDMAIVFDHLIPASTVKIFTLSGHEVRTLSADGNSVSWDRANSSGDKVASGVYLYVITDPQNNNSKGKLAILR